MSDDDDRLTDAERVLALEALVTAFCEKACRGYRPTDCCLLCYATPGHHEDCPVPLAAAVVGYKGKPFPLDDPGWRPK